MYTSKYIFPIDIGKSDPDGTYSLDGAMMFTCDSATGGVTKTTWKNRATDSQLTSAWPNGVCDEISQTNSKRSDLINENGATGGLEALHVGITADGSGSGAINTDYLMGLNCPLLATSSGSCTDYMVVKRYGDKFFIDPSNSEELAYQDIGRGANGQYTDAEGNCYGKGTGDLAMADYFVIPVGCVRIGNTGSNLFWTDGSSFGWQHWSDVGCTGTEETAQSDEWVLNQCGIFDERTHCGGQGGSQTICNTGGVLVTYDYYFEAICDERTHCGGQGGSQTICNTGGVLVTYDYYFEAICMPSPHNAVAGVPECGSMYNQAQSNAPTYDPITPTPPTTVPINTCPACPPTEPTAPASPVTPKPTGSPTTKAPTDSSGTAKPTGSPTTAQPTDASGTAKPTVTKPTEPSGPSGSGTPTEPTKAPAAAVRVEFIMTVVIGCISVLIM
eukprot:CAMPEP_0201592502 /NCGR_PEP_ID=MMETSP0190_2-20130828/190381_1 /ASSEMBLY_ACC=CAM_ASM_000263 /TAXON_ID=37353 /ORGANISM="Rosalina sp." /LENGTH=443 /DNA_ID=CAMNT_0048051307 /DNA_START=89 /DNA_END=1421 /DNA_ORIENTATION=+